MTEPLERFNALTDEMSLREAADQTGLSHSTIARLRAGDWAELHPSTRRKVQEWLERQDTPPPRARAPSNHTLQEITERVIRLAATDPTRLREVVELLMSDQVKPLWEQSE